MTDSPTLIDLPPSVVTSAVFGYHKYDPKKNLFLETIEVFSAPLERWTHGFWVDGMCIL